MSTINDQVLALFNTYGIDYNVSVLDIGDIGDDVNIFKLSSKLYKDIKGVGLNVHEEYASMTYNSLLNITDMLYDISYYIPTRDAIDTLFFNCYFEDDYSYIVHYKVTYKQNEI
jgi:hypothetical protein